MHCILFPRLRVISGSRYFTLLALAVVNEISIISDLMDTVFHIEVQYP